MIQCQRVEAKKEKNNNLGIKNTTGEEKKHWFGFFFGKEHDIQIKICTQQRILPKYCYKYAWDIT